jgi:hypothetical protein
VLGPSPIVAPLREIAAKKTVDDRPIVVKQVLSADSIGRPHVLFISREAAAPLAGVLAALRGSATLTVAERPGSCQRGVAVNFVIREGAIRFEVNERALLGASLVASSQLMQLAIRADGEAERPRK